MKRIHRLNDIADVSRVAPADQQILAYDDATKAWKPTTASGGAGGSGPTSLRTQGTTDYNTLVASAAAYWQLDDASGGTYIDSSPNGNDFTTVGATPVKVRGGLGYATRFRALSNEYLSIASNSYVQLGPVNWTITAWFFLEEDGGTYTLIAKDNGSSDREYGIHFNPNRMDCYAFTASNSAKNNSSENSVKRGVWNFVRFWYDNAAQTTYAAINEGEPVSLALGGAVQAAGSQALYIGRNSYAGNYWPGRIREVGIFKKLLSTAEVDLLWNYGFGP